MAIFTSEASFGCLLSQCWCFRAYSQVFEQDAHAFTRRLNGILTPGPICYVARIDAFVVGNSEMGVDCYKYQVNSTLC